MRKAIIKILRVTWYKMTMYSKVKAKQKEADRKNFKYGDAYYVLPIGSKLLVVNNRWRKRYNQLIKRSGTPKISYLDMEKQSIYKAIR